MAQPVRLRARIASVTDHAEGLRSLALEPERPVPRFNPGQFLHLALDPYDPSRHWPDSRPFSIASAPAERQRIEITVSEVGAFTKRVMEVEPGQEVWIKLPYGEFIIDRAHGAGCVLAAGGTGVTPFLSFLRQGGFVGGSVKLLYGARRPDLLIFRGALDAVSSQVPGFQWVGYSEEAGNEAIRAGRPSAEDLLEIAATLPQPDRCLYYLSGPPAMLQSLGTALHAAGVDPARVRIDAWR